MNDSTNKVLLDVADNGVATITLNNPDKHNAFDDSVIELLIDALNTVSNNEDTRILVLASSGKSFSAGADLGWMKRMAAYDYEENLTDSRRLALLFHTLNTLNKPTIAKIQGAAFGGAVGLAACCDIVIASTRASFCLSEVKLGCRN